MKKLIPALALLLISAVVLSTASYAWFSMNTRVTAGDMEIKASAGESLLISKDKSAWTTDSSITVESHILLPTTLDSGASAEAGPLFKANVSNAIDSYTGTETAETLSVNKMTAGGNGTITLSSAATTSNIATLYKSGSVVAVYDSVFIATENGMKDYKLQATVRWGTSTEAIYSGVKVGFSTDGFNITPCPSGFVTSSDSTPVDIATSIGDKTNPTTVYIILYIDGNATSTTTENALASTTALGGISFKFDAVKKTP